MLQGSPFSVYTKPLNIKAIWLTTRFYEAVFWFIV
jgi:hypothetical protein